MKTTAAIDKARKRAASTMAVREYMAVAFMAGMYADHTRDQEAAERAQRAVWAADALIEELAK